MGFSNTHISLLYISRRILVEPKCQNNNTHTDEYAGLKESITQLENVVGERFVD
jgi:hypothetical protein